MEIWGVGVSYISNFLVPHEDSLYVYEKPIDIELSIPKSASRTYNMSELLKGGGVVEAAPNNFFAKFSPYCDLITCEGRNIPELVFVYADHWGRLGLVKINSLTITNVTSGLNLEVEGRFDTSRISMYLSDTGFCDSINLEKMIKETNENI